MYRIGLHIYPSAPFWIEVDEAIRKRLGEDVVTVELQDPYATLSEHEETIQAEEILAHGLDAFIGVGMQRRVLELLLDAGIPVIYLIEFLDVRHPRYACPIGLYDAGRLAATYLAGRLDGRGCILAADGYIAVNPHASDSRMAGIRDALKAYPGITLRHSVTSFRYAEAYDLLRAELSAMPVRPDAVLGLIDPVALAAREAARAVGIADQEMLVVGINGDPLALAAIVKGAMSATVATPPEHIAGQAADLALRAARGEPLPPHYSYQPYLVTAENVAQAAAASLDLLAEMPSRLVGVNRQAEQSRLRQLETSAAINRHVGALLDRRQQGEELAKHIQADYGYDCVHILRWSEGDGMLFPEHSTAWPAGLPGLRVEEEALLVEVLRTGQPVFVSDMQQRLRFPADERWPRTRARVVMPIRLGDQMLGLLDLHSWRPRGHLQQEMIGLQALADHLAIAMRNADLYTEALRARAAAENADQLKTRLLANVSHELRTPLNVILGYSRAALDHPDTYGQPVPDGLQADLNRIYRSGEHLIRLINDLLDLSRAEIGELSLFRETVAVRPLLEDVFHTMSDSAGEAKGVAWRLELPDRLPPIEADGVRLRQILLNLLSNAAKFTAEGSVTLGAEAEPPYLHFWVQDTGPGIPLEQQERIFQPFVSIERARQRPQGVGLGLAITRRLVALHGGMMTLESRPEQGSCFHVYLPLPSLSGRTAEHRPLGAHPVLLLIAGCESPAPEIMRASQRCHAPIRRLKPGDDLDRLLEEVRPVAIAWDVSEAADSTWTLIQRLRMHPLLCQAPFLLYGMETRRPAAGAGVTDVLTKPVSSASLADAISALQPGHADRPVLVVDDDPQALALYNRVITEALPGQAIRSAGNGAEALAIVAEQIPALVILDLMMPEIDGFTVLERLRAEPRTRLVPVIVLSGKLLSLADIQRLNRAQVLFQSKNVLNEQEQIAQIRRVFAGDILPQPTGEVVKHALAYIHENYDRPVKRAELAAAGGICESYLSTIFHQEMGIAPWEYLTRLRIQIAREALAGSDVSVTEVAGLVGFDDPGYFCRVFRKYVGQSPQSYRRDARA